MAAPVEYGANGMAPSCNTKSLALQNILETESEGGGGVAGPHHVARNTGAATQ